jgi:hypothetical protein
LQYRNCECRSSIFNYLDHPAQSAKNLDQKWPNSQNRNFAQTTKLVFATFTASSTQEFINLSNKTVLHTTKFFSDSNINSILITHSQRLKMDESQNSPTPNVINALPQGHPINLPGKPVLDYCKYPDSFASKKSFTAARIAYLSSKYGFDISPYVNCSTDPVTLPQGLPTNLPDPVTLPQGLPTNLPDPVTLPQGSQLTYQNL